MSEMREITTASAAGAISAPRAHRSESRGRGEKKASWLTKDRPLVSKVFYVSVVFIVVALFVVPQFIRWRQALNSWIDFLVWSVPVPSPQPLLTWAQLALLALTLSVPMLLAVYHGRTIELLHRTLHSEDSNPQLFYEPARSAASAQSGSPSKLVDRLWRFFHFLYGTYRNYTWFLGLISIPTFGSFLRVILLPLPNYFTQSPWYNRWAKLSLTVTTICGIVSALFWPLLASHSADMIGHVTLPVATIWPVSAVLLFLLLPSILWGLSFVFGLVLNNRRVYHRACIYIEVHHLLSAMKFKAAAIRNEYELRVREFERSFWSNTAEQSSQLSPIECGTLFDVFKADDDDEIRTYFEVQEMLPRLGIGGWLHFFWQWVVLGSDGSNKSDDEETTVSDTLKKDAPQFLCPVRIGSGFLCPTYLVSGLLNEFDENWELIVRNYGVEMEWLTGADPLQTAPEIRKLQAFIWSCWIQWGPSVPIHNSNKWTDNAIGVQYGYGDENNSLPLSYRPAAESQITAESQATTEPQSTNGDTRWRWKDWEREYHKWQREGKQAPDFDGHVPLVIPASMTARLRWTPDRTVQGDGQFCTAQQKSEAWLSLEASKYDFRWDDSKLYSAYIWVMIAICARGGSNGAAASSTKPSPLFRFEPTEGYLDDPMQQTWRGLIPFFQHGNVAEESVLRNIKEELAIKTVETLMGFLKGEPQLADGRKIEFCYVCAFDGNGDGNQSESLALRVDTEDTVDTEEVPTIRKLMESAKNRYQLPSVDEATADAIKQRLHLEERAVLSLTACELPRVVERYLKTIKSSEIEIPKDVELLDLRTSAPPATPGSDWRDEVLTKAYTELYEKSFPFEEEQEPLEQYRARVLGADAARRDIPQTHFLVAGQNLERGKGCTVNGFLVVEWYRGSNCGLFTYLTVSRAYRNRGIARMLIREGLNVLRNCAAADQVGLRAIFAETGDPAKAKANGTDSPAANQAGAVNKPSSPKTEAAPRDTMHKGDRICVLDKLGAWRIPIADYVQPALQKDQERSRRLMLLAFNPDMSQPPADVNHPSVRKDVVVSFLDEFYKTLGVENPAADGDFKEMLKQLGEQTVEEGIPLQRLTAIQEADAKDCPPLSNSTEASHAASADQPSAH